MSKIIAVLFLFLSLSSGVQAAGLTLDEYLAQVDSQNQNIRSAKLGSEGAELSTSEVALLYYPSLFAETSFLNNHFRNATFPSAYTSLETNNYTVGIRQQTKFGLSGSLSYLFSNQAFLGAIDQKSLQLVDRRFWEGTPKLELNLSLLRNFAGAETKANETVALASARASEFNQSYLARATHAEASIGYVKLVSAQQLVKLYQNSFADAEDILNWNQQRMRRNLGESTDVLQAEGNFESQKLAFQASHDEERIAARNFNRLRNVDSDQVNESLSLPGIEDLSPPPRGEIRDDVRAAQEEAKLRSAQAELGLERNRPNLEAYGSFALNDRDASATDTFTNSFRPGQQTTLWGVRLNVPLAFGLSSDARRGYQKQRDAAEIQVAQKLFDQEVEWKDLVQQLSDAKKRYDIAASLSKIQKKKMANERVRLKSGRTTTYQTLIFNIDFDSAEVARIQAQTNVLSILARMKTFGESKI